jgi:hypothetical protein
LDVLLAEIVWLRTRSMLKEMWEKLIRTIWPYGEARGSKWHCKACDSKCHSNIEYVNCSLIPRALGWTKSFNSEAWGSKWHCKACDSKFHSNLNMSTARIFYIIRSCSTLVIRWLMGSGCCHFGIPPANLTLNHNKQWWISKGMYTRKDSNVRLTTTHKSVNTYF